MPKSVKKDKESIKFTIDERVYPLPTIYATSYVFLDRAYVYLDKDTKGKIIIHLFSKDKKENIGKLKLEFYNELVNYAHYFSSLKINAGVVKALMQRALFSAAPSLLNESGKKEIENLIKELQTEESQENSGK
jgi:His-Xaa-Ser system protein HxsD